MKKNLLSTSYNMKSDLVSITIPYLDLDLTDLTPEILNEPEIFSQPRNLSAYSKFVQLERYQISTKFSNDLVSDLQHFHGVDAGSMINNVISEEFLVKKESLLYSLYLENAKIKLEPRESKFGGWIRKKLFSGRDFPHYINIETQTGSSKVVDLIYEASFRINDSCVFGPGNFVVCSPRICSLISNDRRFVSDNDHSFSPINTELLGHLNSNNRIDVYVNPKLTWEDTTIIVGRSNWESLENGTYIVEKTDSPTIETMESLHQGLEKVTRGVHYMTVGNLSRESTYSRFVRIDIATGKKPFWRKLLYLFGVE